MKLEILYEDNHLFVCIKEAGILSQASDLDLPDMLTIIKDYIKIRDNKPGNVYLGLVHRLDLNVGGVMVFAKTSKAAARLSKQVRSNEFNKGYFAVVCGKIEKSSQDVILENYLIKDERLRKAVITNNKKDLYSKLSFTSLDNKRIKNKHYSLLDINLETGRFHQIRAQLAYMGNPIYGDNKYGNKTRGYEIGLYAYMLTVRHPVSNELLTFKSYPNKGIFRHFEIKKE